MRREIAALTDLLASASLPHHIPLYKDGVGWDSVLAPTFDVRADGATGDGTTVDTEAAQVTIQRAVDAGGGTVVWPDGDYYVPGLTLDGDGVTFASASRTGTRLKTNSGSDLLTFAADVKKFSTTGILYQSGTTGGGGGHIFKALGNFIHGLFENLTLIQDNPGKSVFWQESGDHIDNLWLHIDEQHSLSATVESWHIKSPAVSRNIWLDVRPTYSGNYVWMIETTDDDAFANDNLWIGVNAETTRGGLIKLLGARGSLLMGIGVYDLGTTTRDLIVTADSATGLPCGNTTLFNVRRHSGTLGSGLYDVDLAGAASTPKFLVVNCGGATDLQINAHNKRITVIEDGDVVVANDAGARYIGRNPFESVTANTALEVVDSGKTLLDQRGSGTTVFTLPPTARGAEFTFVCGNASGQIAVSPDAADKIMGKGITAADDKDYINTAATNAIGDAVTIVGDGVDGWWVTNERGTWAREA